MKYWIRLLLLVGAVLGFFALILSLLPRSYDFSTAMEINAPPEKVFAEINRLQSWPSWSRQWNVDEIDELVISYNKIESGEGAAQTWTDRRGKGKLWISQVVENESINYDMKFSNFPVMKSSFTLTTAGQGTKVVWSSKGSLPGGPMYGVLAPFFPDQMTYEYNKSLARLKANLEGQ